MSALVESRKKEWKIQLEATATHFPLSSPKQESIHPLYKTRSRRFFAHMTHSERKRQFACYSPESEFSVVTWTEKKEGAIRPENGTTANFTARQLFEKAVEIIFCFIFNQKWNQSNWL